MGEFAVIVLIVLTVLILAIAQVVTIIRRLIWGRPKPDQIRCPFCHRWTPARQPRCDWCGRERYRAESPVRADLVATERQLLRMQKAGFLTETEVDRLLTQISLYRKQLATGQPPAAPVASAPPAPKAEEPASSEIVEAELADEVPPDVTPSPPAPKPPARPSRPAALPPDLPRPKPKPASPVRLPVTPRAEKPVGPAPPVRPPEIDVRPPAPQQAAASVAHVPPAEKPEPRAPRRSWTEILGAFMEDRNIRIGELVGGLLFVVFSVLLTINLSDKIPHFQFFALVGVTSAVFGAGLYAHHRWRLESTSLSLLVIATLLVPLNFFTMVDLSRDGWDWISRGAELGSLALFAWLLYQAARVLVPRGPWHQVVAVLGNSVAVLVLGRLVGAGMSAVPFLAVGLVPVALCGGSIGTYLAQLPSRRRIDARETAALFTLLGTATFATLVPLAVLVVRSRTDDPLGLAVALDRIGPIAVVLAGPLLAVGLTVMRGTSRDRSLGPYRTAATAIALVAVLLMLAALALAWPVSLEMTAVSLLSTAILLYAAFRHRAPFLHAGVIAFGATAYLTGFHYLMKRGEIGEVPREALSQYMVERILQALRGPGAAVNALALIGLSALLVGVGQWLARAGMRRHGRVYFLGAGAVGLLSIGLVTSPGLWDVSQAIRAAIVYGVYGAALLAANVQWRNRTASYVGLGLLAASPLWVARWLSPGLGPNWALILSAEALGMILVAVGLIWSTQSQQRIPWAAKLPPPSDGPLSWWDSLVETYRLPLLNVGEAVAILAIALSLWCALAAPGIERSPALVLTIACLTAAWMLLAWAHRSVPHCWAGSMILLAGLVHTLVWNYAGVVEQPWLVALLSHATAAVVAGLGLELWMGRAADASRSKAVRRVFIEPLSQSALSSSVLVLPLLPFVWSAAYSTLSLALCLYWLAGIWLVIAWTHRLPIMLAAHQAVLAVATLVATTAWLEYVAFSSRPMDVRSLQAYGISLALLCLVWVVVRILLRGNQRAARLLEPGWPMVDRIMLHALVTAQLALLAAHLLRGCWCELLTGGTMTIEAFGPGAWALVAALAVALAVALWDRWRVSEWISALLLAVAVPCLMAGRVADQLAAASALRWWLGLYFLIGSIALWQRRRLRAAVILIRANVRLGRRGTPLAGGILLATAALPVLALTLAAALIQLLGIGIARPDPSVYNVFFHRIDANLSYLVPLVLVLVGMVGTAVRQRSAGYAFGAGLVAVMAVVLGYALSIVTAGRSFGTTELVTLLQLATITAAGWGGAWLIARRWVDVWREDARRITTASRLMGVQIAMAVLGNVLLLVGALFCLTLFTWHPGTWPVAAGLPLGWVALALTVAAIVCRRLQAGHRPRPEMAGLVGMAVLALLACSVEAIAYHQNLSPVWGYRTLMLGWASYALFVVAATWWVATIRTLPDALGPPQALVRAASLWVGLAGGLAVLLGIKAAMFHPVYEDLLWAAGAIAVASMAGATMAFWRRNEVWAFTAALGVNLAASLAVWFFQRELPLEEWWLRLVQGNVIATAAVALVWLAARRRLYALGEMSIRTSPLLGVQTALAVIGNALLLAMPVARLLVEPQTLPGWAAETAAPAGWAALLLTVAAVAWYLYQTARPTVFHAVGGLAVAVPVLLCCLTAGQNMPLATVPWASYHVLMAALAVAGLLLLAAAMAVDRRAVVLLPGDAPPELERNTLRPDRQVIRAWLAAIGVAVVAMACLWAHRDVDGVWWRVGAVLSVSLVAGVVAMWHRLPRYVFASGFLFCVAGTLLWMADGPDTLAALIQTNALCLAVAATLWTLVELLDRRGVPVAEFNGWPWPFAHVAALAGLAALVLSSAAILACLLLPIPIPPAARVGIAALVGVVVAMVVLLWDRRASFPLLGLYLLGPTGIALIMHGRAAPVMQQFWTMTTELPGFVIAVAAAGWVLARVWRAADFVPSPAMQSHWLLPRAGRVIRLLRIPDGPGRWSVGWFMGAQAALTIVSAALVAWVAIDFRFDPVGQEIARFGISGRLASLFGALMVLGTTIVMANHLDRRWDRAWQYAAFGAGLLLQCTIGWALLSAENEPAWLHRNVTLLVASTMITLLSGAGLSRILRSAKEWAESGRRVAPYTAALALFALAAVLAQEVYFFVPKIGAPLTDVEMGVVTAALVGLILACLAFAVVPGLDRLGLSQRGRTVYVYAAEVLVVLLCVHIRLCRPEWFDAGIIRRYWMLIVMAVAFVGAGLSEWFHRRRLPVLSEPLEWTAFVLPFAPALGYWFLPPQLNVLDIEGRTPAVWLLLALFYLVAAVQRRPAGRAIPTALAILAGNTGLWVLWHRMAIGIVDHPQLWLIPVGLCVLVAEYMNHRRLDSTQSGVIRYLALALIYVSSTADMFITGIGESVWLPLVLMFLCVAGVLLGILLRVRSFLVLGITFLLVLVATMVNYAAFELNQIWILYACGVATATAIIALFAVFEKRRNDILEAAEKFKKWER